jgi:tetratricopeptide (TPR) repeat protein
MSGYKRSILLLPMTLVVASGCNIDGLFADHQHRDAPLTSFDRPEGVEIPDIVIIDGSEVDMVEQVLANRAVYKRSLDALRDFYERRGSFNKMQWAETELKELGHVKPFRYIMSAEVPAEDLRPARSIAEADRMYDEGVMLMRRGGHNLPVVYRKDYMHEAMQVFTEMITRYPDSDKIDDAAFECGEILKEYYVNQDRLALQWYQRAREWDPHTPHPVLFQSAVVCDFRLHDRARALELYQRVLQEETSNRSNTAFASKRIYELTNGGDVADDPYLYTREPGHDRQAAMNSAQRSPNENSAASPRYDEGSQRTSEQNDGWRNERSGDGVARSGQNNSSQSSYDRYD